jgi:hypothetical protein
VSRRPFAPTQEQRDNVEAMIGFGLTEEEICSLVKNPETGKPIDQKTLRKHFRAEITAGAVKLKALAGQRITATMLGRPGGIRDPRAEATLLIFFAKTRMGWKETTIQQHSGRLEVSVVRERFIRRVTRLAADARAGEALRDSE